MKRIWIFLCCLSMFCTLTACEGDRTGDPLVPPSTNTEQSKEESKTEQGEETNGGGTSSEGNSSFKPITSGGNYTPNEDYK